MNFKFGRLVPRDSPDMTLTNVSEKWAWSWSRDPVNFWALTANSSKTAKDTNFTFGTRVPRLSPDKTTTNVSVCYYILQQWISTWSQLRKVID